MLDYKFDFSTVSELKCDPQSGIDIVIAGGGPGGLFAALYCYRKGHNVKVLESSGGYDLNGQSVISLWKFLIHSFQAVMSVLAAQLSTVSTYFQGSVKPSISSTTTAP